MTSVMMEWLRVMVIKLNNILKDLQQIVAVIMRILISGWDSRSLIKTHKAL